MKHIINPLSTLLLSILLVGCASHPGPTGGGTGPEVWWKPGVTDQQEIIQAMARCRVTASMSSTGSARVKNPFAATALDKHRQGGVTYDCLIGEGYRYTRQSLVPAGLAFVAE
jgi:hypothetical protein